MDGTQNQGGLREWDTRFPSPLKRFRHPHHPKDIIFDIHIHLADPKNRFTQFVGHKLTKNAFLLFSN